MDRSRNAERILWRARARLRTERRCSPRIEHRRYIVSQNIEYIGIYSYHRRLHHRQKHSTNNISSSINVYR